MRPPTLAPNASQPPHSEPPGCASTDPCETCTASSIGGLGSLAPNYGAGVGPAYLSGQYSWYSAGQVAILMVDSNIPDPSWCGRFSWGVTGNRRSPSRIFPRLTRQQGYL